MKRCTLRSLTYIVTLVAVAVLLVTTVMANDSMGAQDPGHSDEPQFPQEQRWLEWDGISVTSRPAIVSSAAEEEFIEEWNRMNSEQARIGYLYQSGQLPETPERDVRETEYGIVTVEKTVSESSPIVQPSAETSVEVERVETPYGTITIEKQSFGETVGETYGVGELGEEDAGVQPFALSEYTDFLNQTCGSSGVEFNFGSNNTLSNYELHWSGGSYADYVVCSSTSCSFKITTSWGAYYTYGKAYTTSPGYVHGFGFDDYRCR